MQIIQEWLRDFGTEDNDRIVAFAADGAGGVYIAGYSEAIMVSAAQVEQVISKITTAFRKGVPTLRELSELRLNSEPDADNNDRTQVWLMRYTADGALTWKKDLALCVGGLSMALATDADGDLILASHAHGAQPTLTKYGARGNERWSVSITDKPAKMIDVAIDGEKNIFVAFEEAVNEGLPRRLISQYESNSRFVSTTEKGGAVDKMTFDGEGHLIVAGRAPWGVFLSKLSHGPTDMQEVWRRQLDVGTDEQVTGIAVDQSNNVYMTGVLNDDEVHAEVEVGTDAWLAKYSRDGDRQWYQRLTSSAGQDYAAAVVVDRGGYVYVAGHTNSELVPGALHGECDIWMAKYLPNGSEIWRHQQGITDNDSCYGMALDSSGHIYLVGITEPEGALPNDGWVCRLREEPDTPGEMWSLVRAYLLDR